MLFLKNLLFTLILPGTMGVYIPLWLASRDGTAAGPWLATRVPALVLMAVGAAIYFWCLWRFAVDGRATPAPIDAPRVLVIRGPYRYVRNPMYLGVGLVIAGWALWFRSADILWFLLIWAFFVALFVLFYEEPTLRRLFGAQYERYRAAVGRWIPGRPWSGEDRR